MLTMHSARTFDVLLSYGADKVISSFLDQSKMLLYFRRPQDGQFARVGLEALPTVDQIWFDDKGIGLPTSSGVVTHDVVTLSWRIPVCTHKHKQWAPALSSPPPHPQKNKKLFTD